MIDLTRVNRAFEYAQDVISGEEVAGKYIILAAERFVNDLERSQDPDDDFPWVFDLGEGREVHPIHRDRVCAQSGLVGR